MIRFRDELYDAQLLRAIGHAPYGGAAIGECLAAAERIETPDGPDGTTPGVRSPSAPSARRRRALHAGAA